MAQKQNRQRKLRHKGINKNTASKVISVHCYLCNDTPKQWNMQPFVFLVWSYKNKLMSIKKEYIIVSPNRSSPNPQFFHFVLIMQFSSMRDFLECNRCSKEELQSLLSLNNLGRSRCTLDKTIYQR